MKLTVKEAASAAGGRVIFGEESLVLEHISLNSKKMRGKDLFVPVIGERVDAHRFIGGAFEAGAVCSLSSAHRDREALLSDPAAGLCEADGACRAVIAVEDTRAALQALGTWYRKEQISYPLIGVTGSVGKTTTREMVACALSAGKRVYATKGNSNSQVGVPITMTEAEPSAEIGVIELGMSEFHEMSRISKVACVNCAIITNIGISHINQLKTQENIMIEKLHILDGMPDGALLLLNGDDPMLAALSEERIHAFGIAEGKHIRLCFYGTGENADVRAESFELCEGLPRFTLRGRVPVFGGKKENGKERVSEIDAVCALSVPGGHMILNTAAAVAAAAAFGVAPEEAAKAMEGFRGVSGRGERYEKDGITIIDDSYNAAPASMKAGLLVLRDLPAEGCKYAVLADMLELGDEELSAHREIGRFLTEEMGCLTAVFLYGPRAEEIRKSALSEEDTASGKEASGETRKPEIFHFDSKEALSEALRSRVKKGDMVFFKGSNGMGLSEVVKQFL